MCDIIILKIKGRRVEYELFSIIRKIQQYEIQPVRQQRFAAALRFPGVMAQFWNEW